MQNATNQGICRNACESRFSLFSWVLSVLVRGVLVRWGIVGVFIFPHFEDNQYKIEGGK